jgi:hypothetical protein
LQSYLSSYLFALIYPFGTVWPRLDPWLGTSWGQSDPLLQSGSLVDDADHCPDSASRGLRLTTSQAIFLQGTCRRAGRQPQPPSARQRFRCGHSDGPVGRTTRVS